MEHTISHDVGRERAKKATLAAMDSYAAKYREYDPRATWTSDSTADVSMHVKGITLTGKLSIEDREIILTLDVPFLFRPVRARALAIVDREVESWLARAKAGEFD